jgi:neutral ceramidase
MMMKASAVQVDITPPVGCFMSGYMERKSPSVGIHDPLKAQVLMLSLNGSVQVIVTMDVIAVNAAFTDAVREFVQEELQIDGKHVMVACSHTHSGPQGFLSSMPAMNEISDPSLSESILRKITGAIQWANTTLNPVNLFIGRDTGSGIGLNRNDPINGLNDREVTVLRVDDLIGKPVAVLFNYGCHATVMGDANLMISADFPGAARNTLEALYPGTVFMFCNGGAGDVSTRFTRRQASFDEVGRFGRILAGAVMKAMETAEPSESNLLECRSVMADLPVKSFPSKDAVDSTSAELKAQLAEMQKNNQPMGEQRKLVTRIEGTEILMRLSELFAGQKSVPAEMQIRRVGDLVIVTIPGEPFSKTVLDIKSHFLPSPVMLVSYANDYKGYLPESAEGSSATYEDFVSPYTGEAALAVKQAIMAGKD